MKPKTPAPASVWSLVVTTLPEAEDAVGQLLQRATGESPIATHDRRTGKSSVAVYLDDPARWTPALRATLREGLRLVAECGLEVGSPRVSFRRVPPTDWRESWKKHFRPLAIGRRLLVRPSWSRRRPVDGQAELVLDPGLSFGTGQHPTTEFCLREVVRLRPRDPARPVALLDAGTGSGILALAAARLGYRPVVAFDFDPEAVQVAVENARANRLSRLVAFSKLDVARLSERPRRVHEVVCANLQSDLLLRHAARLVAQVAPGGHLVLAGILASEFDAVRARFEAPDLGLRLIRHGGRREWRSGSFARG